MRTLLLLSFFIIHQLGQTQEISTIGGAYHTGKSSFLCSSGSFLNPANIISSSESDFTTFYSLIGVGCSYYIQSTLNQIAPAGAHAGFKIAGSNLGSVLSGLTIKTYLGNTLQETASSGSFLTLLSWSDNDLYFTTTKSFDAVRLEISGLALINYSLDIYKGYALTSSPFTLPVIIKDFKIAKKEGKAQLSWKIEAKRDEDRLIIEKSADGKIFYPLREVKGAGESLYTFLDEDWAGNKCFYRIRCITPAGKNYYSIICEYSAASNTGFAITHFSKQRLSFESNMPAGDNIINVVSINGREVYQSHFDAEKTGETKTVYFKQALRPGTYLISLYNTGSKRRFTTKYIVQ